MARLLLLSLLAAGCYREAKPCDDASFEALAETCAGREDCEAKLHALHQYCAERLRGEQ